MASSLLRPIVRRHSGSGELRWLIRQAWPYRSLYLLRISTVFLTSLLALIDPLILKWLIDQIIPWRQEGMLVVASAGLFFVFLFRFGLTGLSLLTDTYTGQRLAFDLRNGLLRHLQALSPEYHLTTPKGQTLHRLEQDIDQICELGGHTLASLFRIATLTLLSLTIMLALNWKLTLLLLPLVPLMLFLRRQSQHGLRTASDRVQAASAERVGFLQDHLSSMVQVQLLNRAASERRRFARLGRTALEAQVKRQGKELKLAFSSQVALVAATALVVGFGGAQVLAGTLTIGGLVAFYSYLNRIFSPVETVIHLYAEVQRAGASIRRVREVLAVRPTILDAANPRSLPKSGAARVQVTDLSFGYAPSQPVLEGFDMTLAPGERVALVGASGSGKSTIARLLTRQADPWSGELLLDGVPLRDLRLRQLRQLVALVPQDPLLFDTTLEQNIRFADPRASEKDLAQVLSMAQLDSVVSELADGRQQRVGPRGELLSGGQRQRVAIARAILQKPRLLILDEATSGLDGITEHRLFSALEEFAHDRTVLLIAHRLSAIRWANRIIAMDGGRVVASGSHTELYATCNLYRRLCEEQLRDEGMGSGRLPREEGPLMEDIAI